MGTSVFCLAQQCPFCLLSVHEWPSSGLLVSKLRHKSRQKGRQSQCLALMSLACVGEGGEWSHVGAELNGCGKTQPWPVGAG